MIYAVCGAVGPCLKRGAREESPVRRGGPMCGFRFVKCELSLCCPGGAAKSTSAYGVLVWRRLSGPVCAQGLRSRLRQWASFLWLLLLSG